jgi:type 1 glutamine amidotransferase
MEKMKAILIGEYSVVEWHPLAGTDKALQDILSDFEVDCTEDYDSFKTDCLNKYDLCISYVDHWKESLTDEQTAGLLTFVCNGGGLLIIHNGIAIQSRAELAQLAGAKFTSHPQERVLTFHPVAEEHIITEGISAFSFLEEPYQFERDNFARSAVLLEYDSEGQKWPAAWVHQYALGKVVYLSPGHHPAAFQDTMYRKLIRRSALWTIGML